MPELIRLALRPDVIRRALVYAAVVGAILIAINLQTSFLTPPFGFSLFYLRSAAPPEITTGQIYQGVIPFIALQLFGIFVIWLWPSLANWLPSVVF